MVNGERYLEGVAHLTASNGIKVFEIPGDGSIGPFIAVLIFSASGLPPNDPNISIVMYPVGISAQGTNALGEISVSKTFTNSGNDKLYSLSGFADVNFVDGFWQQLVRNVVSTNQGTREFYIQYQSFSPYDPLDFTVDAAIPALANIVAGPLTLNPPDNRQWIFDLSWTAPPADTFVLIERRIVVNGGAGGYGPWHTVASVPSVPSPSTYRVYIDTIDPLDPAPVFVYQYWPRPYRYPVGAPPNRTIATPPPENVPSTIPSPTVPLIIIPGGSDGVGGAAWWIWWTWYISGGVGPSPGDPGSSGGAFGFEPLTFVPDGGGAGGGINLAGTSLVVIMGADLSGIYTLTSNKYDDTLYQRITGQTSINVKIPDPFVKTGFLGQ